MKKSIFRRILSIAASVSVLMTLGVGGLAPSAEEAETGYVLNPGFESWNDDGSATNWGLSTTWIKSTDDKKSGEAAVKIEQGAGGAMWNNLVVDDTFDLQAAATLSMWVKYENITGNGFQIGLERPAADKNDNILSDAYTGTSDGWVQLTLSVPASELEVTGWVIKVNFEAGEGTLLVDDVVLNAVAKEEGGDDGDEGEEGGDDGEEQPSADKQPGVVITGEDGVSLITNNGFENGDADWGVVGGASITTEETHSGAKAVKAVMGAEGYSMWSNLKNEVTLDKNEALTLSFWVKLDGVTGDGVSIGVERTCMSMDGKVSDASVYGEPLTGTSDWQKVTLAVPATKDCYSIVVKVNFGAGEGTAYIDDCYFSAADPTKVNLLNNGGFELVNNSSAPTEINAWALSTGWDQMPGAIVTGGDVHGLVHRRLPDTPLRLVHNPPQGDRVVRIINQAEVSHGVPHLPGVVKPVAADDPVRDPAFDQGALNRAGLGVRPVKDGKVPVLPPLVHTVLDGVRDKAGLFVLIPQGMQGKLVPVRIFGPEGLPLPVLVFLDNRIGRAQDIAGGAVILFQPDDRAAGELMLKIQDIFNGGPPEFVNALVVVPHHAEVPRTGGQHADELVLRMVGILVLVHHQVAEPVLVFFQHIRALTEQGDRFAQQVVEIHRVGFLQPVLVQGVRLGDEA